MSESALQRLQEWGAETAIVLGSGLSSLVEAASAEQRIPYREFEHLPSPRVPGHAAEFVLDRVNERPVIYARGRVHLYEGHSASRVAAGVRLLGECGIRRLILTNAAGTLNAKFHPGEWMMIEDHLNLTGTTPLLGTASFVDMCEVYDAGWRGEFRAAAARIGVTLHEGVYAALLGPQYETPAEIRMLRHLGVDAVGMSTVSEAIEARALGITIAGICCLTNWAAGMTQNRPNHEEVLTTGNAAAADFGRLLAAVL